jgi:hypothetical protein
MVRGEILVIDIEQVQELIQEAVNEAAESGTAVTVEYIDKSTLYSLSSIDEKRDIEIRVRAVPKPQPEDK